MKYKGILCSWLQMQSMIRNTYHSNFRLFNSCSAYNKDISKQEAYPKKKKSIEEYFLDPQVYSILIKITGLDYDKIFKRRLLGKPVRVPRYEFATDERLKELEENTRVRALGKLQIPPIMEERKPVDEVLSYDPELQGLSPASVVFIDITPNVASRDRIMSVREPDGTLRKANWDERSRMNQIYFPVPGKKLIVPEYFNSPHLDRLLDEGSYIFILDSVCVQFDPDDPTYLKTTHSTYDHVNKNKKFHELRSTRHFGALAFYLAWNKKIESLLIDMIERNLMDDAKDLVILYHHLNDLPLPDEAVKSDVDIVMEFIEQNTSAKKPDLELALQTYNELQKKKEEIIETEACV